MSSLSESLQGAVAARIRGREVAAELFDFISEYKGNKAFIESFIQEIEIRSGVKQPPVVVSEAPKEESITRLGQTVMPFGQYKGKTFDNVPSDYLDWLCKEQEEFMKLLRSYLKHSQLQSYRGEYE